MAYCVVPLLPSSQRRGVTKLCSGWSRDVDPPLNRCSRTEAIRGTASLTPRSPSEPHRKTAENRSWWAKTSGLMLRHGHWLCGVMLRAGSCAMEDFCHHRSLSLHPPSLDYGNRYLRYWSRPHTRYLVSCFIRSLFVSELDVVGVRVYDFIVCGCFLAEHTHPCRLRLSFKPSACHMRCIEAITAHNPLAACIN